MLGWEVKEISRVGKKISYIAYFSLFVLILLVRQLEVAAREHAHLFKRFSLNSFFSLLPTYRLVVVASSDELRNHSWRTILI